MNVQEDCFGKDIETVECDGGECPMEGIVTKQYEYSDRIVYFSLIIVCTLCVIFAILFAHSKNRKRRAPSFITTDDGMLTILIIIILHEFSVELFLFSFTIFNFLVFPFYFLLNVCVFPLKTLTSNNSFIWNRNTAEELWKSWENVSVSASNGSTQEILQLWI